MRRLLLSLAGLFTLSATAIAAAQTAPPAPNAPSTPGTPNGNAATEFVYAVMETSKGPIVLELDARNAPISVENFMKYVDSKFYDGTIFHRVIDGFMIQGGGYDTKRSQKPTSPPIRNEASNGLKNRVGTIAYARTSDPNSATSQFFINVADNAFLNQAPGNPGYAVFGKVIGGMETVDAIKVVPTNRADNWPLETVEIVTVRRVTPDEAKARVAEIAGGGKSASPGGANAPKEGSNAPASGGGNAAPQGGSNAPASGEGGAPKGGSNTPASGGNSAPPDDGSRKAAP